MVPRYDRGGCGGSASYPKTRTKLEVVLLTVRMEEYEHWTVLHAAGEIDMSSGPVLRNELIGQINEGRIHLAVSLAAVEFIDSTGLGVLLGGLRRARGNGGELRVLDLPDRICEVFALTGMDAIFSTSDTLDALCTDIDLTVDHPEASPQSSPARGVQP